MRPSDDHPVTTSKDRKRLVLIFCGIFTLFSLLVVQFFKIQIMEGEKWTKQAKAQHQIMVKEPFKRGLFYSNTSIKKGHPDTPHPFVVDIPKFHLYADPLSIPENTRDEISLELARFLNLQKEKGKIQEQLSKPKRSRKIVMWIGRQTRDQIDSWWQRYAKEKKIPRNALFFVQDYQRSYPFGKLLGQVLHTVREEKDAATHQCIPTGGLELIFNNYLVGKEGKRLLLRSPRHPLDTGKILSYPENGADIHLTINHYIQAIMEEEIQKAVKSSNAKTGWAIMMDPRTGEILGLAQYPYFDPSRYREYFNDPKKLEAAKLKAVTDAYEPGSTFKPITLAICLKANIELKKRGKPPILIPSEKVATTGGHFPGRSKPIKDTKLHRFLNMRLAMQKSSNVYMARMVQRVIDTLGTEWYRNALQEIFGMGLKTGIELPSESPGLLPMPGKKNPNGTMEWSTPTPYSIAMGHNILVNSLQMLRSFAIIANGGYEVKPTMVRKIIKTERDGRECILLDNTDPKRVQGFKRVLEAEIADQVATEMKFVTKPGGTASKADIYGYTEAGKTGTAEKIVNGHYSKANYFSTFIGFAPAKNARFVLLIAIDEPEAKYVPGLGKNHHGGNCCAPAFREIGSRTLQYLGIESDDPFGYPPGDPRYNPERADCIKTVKELKELYRQWNES